MADFEASIARVGDILKNVNATKSQDPIVNKALFSALALVHQHAGTAPDPVLLANANLQVLEDVCLNKYLYLGRSLQNSMVSIYEVILSRAPGYAVRNVVNAMATLSQSKTVTNTSRECAVAVMGSIMEKRAMDCGSMMTEVMQNMSKLVKGGDLQIRLCALQCILQLINGAGPRITDLHLEVLKLVVKYTTDKSIEVKVLCAQIIAALSSYSGPGSDVQPEMLIQSVTRGLEDENMYVQDAFANSCAFVFFENYRGFIEQIEKTKAAQARGGAGEDPTQSQKKQTMSSRLSKISLQTMSSSQKKIVEDFQLKSIVTYMTKIVVKSSGVTRNGHIAVLTYFVRKCLHYLDAAEIEWVVVTVIEMLHESAILSLSYEDLTYFRSRISYLLSSSVSNQLSEGKLLGYLSVLTLFVGGMEVRHEFELHVVLGEIGHVVAILGEAAVCTVDEVQAAVTVHLRHSFYGVRAAAAYALCSLSEAVPGIAASLLRNSLHNAQIQSKTLAMHDSAGGSGTESPEDGEETDPDGGRRKGSKDIERLQRMFFFHGHTLVISQFIKNMHKLPMGLPQGLVSEVFDFGLELLHQEILEVPPNVRNVACSIARAGSLIVSSCFQMGYKITRGRLKDILVRCNVMFKRAGGNAQEESKESKGVPNANTGDDLLYELMSVEAALVCVSSLLWSSPEALEYEEGCLLTVVEGLEMAFRALKGKYQPKFRTHFRFRTLHAILLECFAWLPPGCYPSSCQQVFVEALRVFRDGVSSGHQCTTLSELLEPDYAVLSVTSFGLTSVLAGNTKSVQSSTADIPLSRDMMILKLEQYASALHKKETEAFLASFGKDAQVTGQIRNQYLPGVDWNAPRAPCGQIDARTIDASLAIIGVTFGHQTSEYQEKAVQLCAQALVQVAKATSSLSMFSSEDEKRRQSRKTFVTVKNVMSCLTAIVKFIPYESRATQISLNFGWTQTVVDLMLELLNNGNLEIRCAAATTLGTLAGRITKSSLLDSVFSQISQAVSAACDKKGDSMVDHAGTVLLHATLWQNARSRPNMTKAILNALLEVMRKTESSSAYFRAHGLHALGTITKELPAVETDPLEVVSQLEKICHCAEVNMVSLSTTEDPAAFYACLQRLVSHALETLLPIQSQLASADERHRKGLDNILKRLIRLWDHVYRTCLHPSVKASSISLFLTYFPYEAFEECLTASRAAEMLAELVDMHEALSMDAKSSLVLSTALLASRHPTLIVSTGLDVRLYDMLLWCVSNTDHSTNVLYSGLDVRFLDQLGPTYFSDSVAILRDALERAIEFCTVSYAKGDLDVNAAHSLLFCRAVALSLRAIPTAETPLDSTASTGNERYEDDDGADEDGGGGGVSSDTAQGAAADSSAVMNVQSFLSRCRENATMRASDLTTSCVAIKRVAVRSAVAVMSELLVNQPSPQHSNIKAARMAIQGELSAFGPNPAFETTANVKTYLCLFMNDIINMGCACATHTVNDKTLMYLQVESLRLLDQVLALFAGTVDPDIILTDEADLAPGQDKIISQFISQMLSAVRPCLAQTTVSFELKLFSGKIICKLVKDRFLTDATALRRLCKALVVYAEDKEGVPLAVRARASQDVSEENAVVDHIVGATNLAQLYAVAGDGFLSRSVDAQIKGMIVSLLQEHLQVLTEIWAAMAIDSARVLQKHSDVVLLDVKRGGDSPSKAHDLLSQVTTLFPSKPSNAPVSSAWPTMTAESDGRRGGLVYSFLIDPLRVYSYFLYALPVTLNAAVCSPKMNVEQTKVLFAMAQASLAHLFVSKTDGEIDIREWNLADKDVSLKYVLATLGTLSRSDKDMEEQIPRKEWTHIVSFLCTKVIPFIRGKENATKVLHAGEGILGDVVGLTGDILSNLTTRLADTRLKRGALGGSIDTEDDSKLPKTEESDQHADKDGLWAWLWTCSLCLLATVFPAPFTDSIDKLDEVYDKILRGEVTTLVATPSLNSSGTSAFFEAMKTQFSTCADSKAGPCIMVVIACLRNLAGRTPATKALFAQLLSSTLPYLSATTPVKGSFERGKAVTFIIDQFEKFAVDLQRDGEAESYSLACGQLLFALISWSKHVTEAFAKMSTSPYSNADVLTAIIDSMLSAWRILSAKVEPSAMSRPLELSSMVYSAPTCPAFGKILVAHTLRLIQSDNGPRGRMLLETIFPAAVSALSCVGSPSQSSDAAAQRDEVELLLVQILFLGFGYVTEDKHGVYVSMLMKPLNLIMAKKPAQSPVVMFVGKGLTHIARVCANAFREQVAMLSEVERTTLQNVMRVALQQAAEVQQQQQTQHGSFATQTAAPSAKKIDFAKFKR